MRDLIDSLYLVSMNAGVGWESQFTFIIRRYPLQFLVSHYLDNDFFFTCHLLIDNDLKANI